MILANGSRKKAPLETSAMCVNESEVTDLLGDTAHREVVGWNVHFMDSSEIEIRIRSGPAIRIPHPRP